MAINQPITAMPKLSVWAARLREIAAQPLEFCPEFPDVARRYDAWWAQDMWDRPVFRAATNPDPSRRVTRRVDLIHDPDLWLETKVKDLRQIRRYGDTLPYVRVEMPILDRMIGAHVEYNPEEDTVWTHPTIDDDWSCVPNWVWQDDHPALCLMRELTRRASTEAVGRFLIATAGTGTGGDYIHTMRGAERLCLDVLEQPSKIQTALDTYYPLWIGLLEEFYDITTERGVGLTQGTVPAWSSRPYIVAHCDFSAMISTDHFRAIFLPEIERHAATVGRCVFHLDGPDVAKHLDAILEIPDIQAIQWVPGAGMASTLSWVPMLQDIQRRGRSLEVICPASDVLPMCEALRPEGLCIVVSDRLEPTNLEDLFISFCREFGC